jgi:hypothetical protein
MASLRKAINSMCKDCIYDSCDSGTWRQQVEACTAYNCSLYDVRPVPIVVKDDCFGQINETDSPQMSKQGSDSTIQIH